MPEELFSVGIPIPERLLRDLSKDPFPAILNQSGQNQHHSIGRLKYLIGPVLETADVADLSPPHRTAAYNALCAIIEKCQDSEAEQFLPTLLDDSIWTRLLEIYLRRSDNTKGKSMRQMLLTLTGMLLKHQNQRTSQLRDHAASTFVDIICHRRDRLQVKPALQGLAHFLQKDAISIADLIELYRRNLPGHTGDDQTTPKLIQEIFLSILSWVVHHDTSLSAGHLLKNFLGSLRRSTSTHEFLGFGDIVSPLWIQPVIETLRIWQDRMQEFKTHVFPHCFLPGIEEYIRFLSYLHFGKHIHTSDALPVDMSIYDDRENSLDKLEEFRVLLAALQTGKELGIVKDVDLQQHAAVEIHRNVLYLQGSLFDVWLSNPEPEVRLAGLYLSVYSTTVTTPISGTILKSLRRNIVHFQTDTDANFRKEVLNHIQRLFDRLKGSTAALSKSEATKRSDNQSRIPFPIPSTTGGKGRVCPSPPDALRASLDFILWYVNFLNSELRATASYQRRTTALRSLTIVLKSGLDPGVPCRHLSKSAQGGMRWLHGLQIVNTQLLRSLLDLVLDPFEDIRNTSVILLELCLNSIQGETKSTALLALPKFIQRAEAMMLRTGRADQADGVARAYSLLFAQCNQDLLLPLKHNSSSLWTKSAIAQYLTNELEETIALARQDLSAAVNGRPVHGTFAALRYIMDQENFYADLSVLPDSNLQLWKSLTSRIRMSFGTLWSCIRDVLCADAPEGHVPEDLDEDGSLDTKEILSYSWRALKEASILLRAIISRAPIGDSGSSILNADDVQSLGKLCFLQLVELRHRGAFSTVAQTFAVVCRRCMTSGDEALLALPNIWYKETLLCIQDKATSITRRSAGIPSLMTGILAAEQQPEGTLFPRAMNDLFEEASREAPNKSFEQHRLPQVHALNCIKEIFTTSRLSAASEAYLGDGLDLAAKTLNSSVWPIRNCGLMLFKALIERILGSDEAQDWKDLERTKSLRFSYGKYPHLVGILFNILDPNGPLQKSMEPTIDNSPMDLHGAEGVFPALQILRQAPLRGDKRHAITSSVRFLLGSPHWHLRDMAAQTLVSLHRPHEYHDAIKKLLASFGGPHNTQHGILLTVKYMLKKYLLGRPDSSPDDLNTILSLLDNKASILCGSDSCPFTTAAFVDLLNVCDLSILLQRSAVSHPLRNWSKCSPSLTITHNIQFKDRCQNNALLRRSSSLRFLINNIVVDSNAESLRAPTARADEVREWFIELAATDSDTCCDILETLGDIICNTPPAFLSVPKAGLLSLVRELMHRPSDYKVVDMSQSILAESLSNNELRLDFFKLTHEADVLKSIEKLKFQCLEGSPATMQSALHLLGYFLDFAFGTYREHRRTVTQDIVHYIRILRMAIVDTNPFDTRYAAIQSISTLDNIWSPEPGSISSRLILGLGLVLYDMLNDDDDEIRDAAAAVASKMLQYQGFHKAGEGSVPIITVQRLGRFLAASFSESSDLHKEALRRVLGTPSGKKLFENPFGARLDEERKEDTALFSHEKQNLYKDEAMDVVFWTNILRSIPSTDVPQNTVADLATWVLDGLSALTETARREVDGPLGWTSKAEVFTLGFSVICAAEVVLRWSNKDAGKVRVALREFADVGSERELNDLWLEKAERVLTDSVSELVRRVYRGLPAV